MSKETSNSLLPSVDYKDSTLYKMVLVLSGFRALYGDSGYEFAQKLKRLKGMDWKYYNTDNNKVVSLVEEGIIKLKREAVEEYSDYICVLYGIRARDRELFYNNLMDFAENQMPERITDLLANKVALLKTQGIIYLTTLSNIGGE